MINDVNLKSRWCVNDVGSDDMVQVVKWYASNRLVGAIGSSSVWIM